MPSIDVIIVNWNAGHLLHRCLNSFAAVTADAVRLGRIIVIDNNSTDTSIRQIEGLSDSLPLEIVCNADNRGFAAACNRAAAGATAEFLLFLNPDTELRPGCLEQPARFLAEGGHERVGIVGVQLLDAQGRVTRSCARRPTWRSMIGQTLGLDRLLPSLFPPHFLVEWAHDETRAVDQVIGAFYFVRRSVFEALGGFDERFFVYFEDLDFALRASDLGWRSVYLASASAIHCGGGTTHAIKDRRLFYSRRSRILFALKYFGTVGAVSLAVSTLVLEPIIRMVAMVVSFRFAECSASVRGFAMLWADIPNIIAIHRRTAKGRPADV